MIWYYQWYLFGEGGFVFGVDYGFESVVFGQ